MKAKNLIAIILVVIITGFVTKNVHAKGPDFNDVIKKAIDENVKYPDFAIERKINGVVVVQFKFNQKGNLEVRRINSVNPELEEYVHRQLEKISIDALVADTSQSYYYKFNFDLQ